MGRLQVFFIVLTLAAFAFSADLHTVHVPAGKLNPFWQLPKAGKKEVKKIDISAFEMMKYPVTVLQFQEFLKSHPDWERSAIASVYADASYMQAWTEQVKKPNSPAVFISWFAARAFCESHHMRLPTINEWEYVAAASETKKEAYKDEKFLGRILDWYGEPRGRELKSVGTIYQNIYGVWDLHGLIWEWVEDFNSSFVTGESREDGSLNKNMFCGSGSVSGADKENYAAFMRFAFRSSLKGNSSAWNLGFRCVK